MDSLAGGGSFCIFIAFTLLFFIAPAVSGWMLRPLIILVLVLQAGGAFATTIPAQAILMARMPADSLSSVSSVMQTIGQTASLTGTTIMLSVVRLVGPEDAQSSYQPVWVLCGSLGLVTFLTACTLSGAQVQTPRATTSAREGSEDEEDAETDSLIGEKRSDSEASAL